MLLMRGVSLFARQKADELCSIERISGHALEHGREWMIVGNIDVARGFADVEALGGPYHALVAKDFLTDASVQFQSVAQVEQLRAVQATN